MRTDEDHIRVPEVETHDVTIIETPSDRFALLITGHAYDRGQVALCHTSGRVDDLRAVSLLMADTYFAIRTPEEDLLGGSFQPGQTCHGGVDLETVANRLLVAPVLAKSAHKEEEMRRRWWW